MIDTTVLTQAPRETAKPHLVIRAGSGWAALNLAELWRFRDLFWAFAGRDLKLRYRQTALGVLWVVLQPLLAAGVFTFVFGTVARLPSDGVPYFVLCYGGLLGWGAFQTTLTRASGCLVQHSSLISKVFFPRLILPLSTVVAAVVDLAAGLALLAVLLAAHGVAVGPSVLLLPVWLLLIVLLGLGLGLFVAALSARYRDVQYVLPVLVQLGLYASPVAYSVAAVPERFRTLYLLNPLAPLLEGARWSLLGRGELSAGPVALAAVLSLSVFLAGVATFRNMERRFADVI